MTQRENTFNFYISPPEPATIAAEAFNQSIDKLLIEKYGLGSIEAHVRKALTEAALLRLQSGDAIDKAIQHSIESLKYQYAPDSPQYRRSVEMAAAYRKYSNWSVNAGQSIATNARTEQAYARNMRWLGASFGAALDVKELWDGIKSGDAHTAGRASVGVLAGMAGGGAMSVFLGLLAVPLAGIGFSMAITGICIATAILLIATAATTVSNYGKDFWDMHLAALLGVNPGDPLNWNTTWGGIQFACNDLFNRAANWVQPRRDPLILDLDGGGISTRAIDDSAPILFDQNADGIRTATGWVGAGEGILVRDLDGNGTIDNGRELFGDSTVLSHGERAGQTARDGFEALADLDSNGDGQFDANDAAHDVVKIWKDANQDGVSQASELISLTDAGVQSIGVRGDAERTNLGGGNIQTHTGTFTQVSNDGAPAQGRVGNLLLNNNGFFRQYTDDPAVLATVEHLPNMRGSGRVRDLHAAMSLSAAPAGTLIERLTHYAVTGTYAEQRNQLDELVQAWGATSDMPTSLDRLREQGKVPGQAQFRMRADAIVDFADTQPALHALITTLERFNGSTILDQWVVPDNTRRGFVVNISPARIALLNDAYAALRDSVYAALGWQTRLAPYLQCLTEDITAPGMQHDDSALIALLHNTRATDARGALFDLMDMCRFGSEILRGSHNALLALLSDWMHALPADAPERVEWTRRHLFDATQASGSASPDWYLGDASDNRFQGLEGNDTLYGLQGNDHLHGGDGNDTIAGGEGDDWLMGENGDDTLHGGAGRDYLLGEHGNDVLKGGEGNDELLGGYGDDDLDGGSGDDVYRSGPGNNRYHFGRGSGYDVLAREWGGDADRKNVLFIREGLLPADIRAVRYGKDLVLHIIGSEERFQVNWFFHNDDPRNIHNQLQEVVFSCGTVWDLQAIEALTITSPHPGYQPKTANATKKFNAYKADHADYAMITANAALQLAQSMASFSTAATGLMHGLHDQQNMHNAPNTHKDAHYLIAARH